MLPVCMGLNDEKQNEDGRNKNFERPRKRLAILYLEHTRRHSNMADLLINEKPLTNLESRATIWSRNVNIYFILMLVSIALLQL